MLKQIAIGVLIMLIMALITLVGSNHMETNANTLFRVKTEGNHEAIMTDLAEIKTTLKFLVKEYDKE